MIQSLRDVQKNQGAIFSSTSYEIDVPYRFGHESDLERTLRFGAALFDRSHWGRIQVSDLDHLRFLHNQTTNNFNFLKPGQGCDTVFVTSTGRTIDLATAYVVEDRVLLLVSPKRRQFLMTWLDKYIFFADRVILTDVTENTVAFSLLGSASAAILEALGVGAIAHQSQGTHQIFSLAGGEVRIAVGSGLATPGYTLITTICHAASLWNGMVIAGAIPMGDTAWEQLRIAQGRPMPDYELTEEFNPLEAGLWHTISLDKGCYIGQETIARLHTYRGVKQQLWGIRLNAAVELETLVMDGAERIGKLTSCTSTDNGFLGLAYIRTKAAHPNLNVRVGEAEGELVPLPFISHEYI